MIVGVGEWGFRELPFEEHCKIAAKFGFRFMELGIGGDFLGRIRSDIQPLEMSRMLECIKDYNLLTPFMCLENDFTIGDTKEIEKAIFRVCREVKLSKHFGATHIRLFAGFTPVDDVNEEIWNNMIKAFKAVNSECKKLGMVISIETHGKLIEKGKGVIHIPTVSTNKETLKRMLKELPNTIGINFDPGNLVPIQADPVISYLDILNERINYCHLKDWVKNDDGSWSAVGVGDGGINWRELLNAMDFNGVYIIEYEPVDDVEDGIARSLKHIRKVIHDVSMK